MGRGTEMQGRRERSKVKKEKAIGQVPSPPPNWVTTVQLPTLKMRISPRKMTVSFYLSFSLMLPRLAARKISFE